jgi:NADH-quinone oxidoreductase subunit M
MDMPWLTVVAALPLVGALLVRALPAALSRVVALVVSLFPLAAVAVMATRFDVSRAGEHQFVERYSWIPSFGVSYASGWTASASP